MSIFDRVMNSTNISLCAFIVPQAKERCICSQTSYANPAANLLAWFDNFKVFLIEFDLLFLDAMGSQFLMRRRCIRYYLNALDISVDGSKTIVGGRPEFSFHNPHLPLPSLTSAQSLHSSLAFLEVTLQESVRLCTGSYR
jgi:hypothetical protein